MKRCKGLFVIFLSLLLFNATVSLGQPLKLSDTKQRGAFTLDPKQNPKEYALNNSGPNKRIEAFIGRRSSMRSGERSSLRWLSRLLKQHPGAGQYVVEWYVPAGGSWWNVATIYEGSTLRLVAARSSVERNPPFSDRDWVNVDTVEIHAVARKGGTFRAFGRGEGHY